MVKVNEKKDRRGRRHARVRSRVFGSGMRPRLSVFRSNKFIYSQIIDDEKNETLVAHSTQAEKNPGTLEAAKKAGLELAKLAEKKKVKKVVFDRGGFIYAGKIKAFAEGAREGGLEF
jgi:large subunit ribosomal protein L18